LRWARCEVIYKSCSLGVRFQKLDLPWTGSVQPIVPSWGAEGFDPYNSGGIASHHIAAGLCHVMFKKVFSLSDFY
jgi:hypothetical protein